MQQGAGRQHLLAAHSLQTTAEGGGYAEAALMAEVGSRRLPQRNVFYLPTKSF